MRIESERLIKQADRDLENAGKNVGIEALEVAGVYLFGSLAEGRAVPGSDADVLVLLATGREP
ncbi:MAG: nucleotidyltransferase domain-containing protein [Gemmatimonadales bacterium]|nr:nucleotidyltransferase domain-containing protein [Gemmatimonadales bacterium]